MMMMMMMPSNSKFCRLECSPKKRRLYERLCTDGVSSSFALYSRDKSPALSQDRRLPSPTDRPPLTLLLRCVFSIDMTKKLGPLVSQRNSISRMRARARALREEGAVLPWPRMA